jgi:hypothetical protein
MTIVAIPYHKEKRYALNHLLDWIDNQTYKDVEVIMRWDLGEYGRKDAVKEQLEYFRQLAEDTDSDLMIVEADTIPPLDVIERLKAHNKDVVGALYYYRSPDKPAVCWREDDPDKEFLLGWEDLVEVGGMGTGCVLLSNDALSEFSFFDFPGTDADKPMYDYLRSIDYKIYLDKSLVCKHYIDEVNYA